MKILSSSVVLIFIISAFISCKNKIDLISHGKFQSYDQQEWEKYFKNIPALKKLPKENIYILKILRVIDPRLPDLTEDQFISLKNTIQKQAEKYLGYKIKFEDRGKTNILNFFDKYNSVFNRPEFRYRIASQILDPFSDNDRQLLKKSIRENIDDKRLSILQNYLPEGKKALSKDEAAEIMFQAFMEKFIRYSGIKTRTGETLRSGNYSVTQDFLYWTSIIYELTEADLIVTNTMIFSADTGMPAYVIKRGGITSAVTENNIRNKFQGAIVLGLFQFLSTELQPDRGDFPDDSLIPAISMITVHELGHLLGRYREYYDLKNSVHVAPVDIRYYDWYRNIAAAKSFSKVKLETLDKF